MTRHLKLLRSLDSGTWPQVRSLAVSLLPAIVLAATPSGRLAAAPEGSATDSVKVPLVLTGGNHFGLQASLDGHPALLMLDTGAPLSAIDPKVYGRDVPADAAGQMPANISRSIGMGTRSVKTGWIQDLQAGPMHFGSGPVALIDLHDISGATSHSFQAKVVSGLLGADILTRYGAAIYWGNGFVYFASHPGGRLQVGPAALKAGWTAIPMEFTNGRHLAVPCSLGVASHLVVDTGAQNTLIDKSVWPTDITQGQPQRYMVGFDGMTAVSPIILKHWQIGNFEMTKSMVGVGKFSSSIFNETTPSSGRIVGILGSEWLYLRNAIIDVGGMTLYLKAPAT